MSYTTKFMQDPQLLQDYEKIQFIDPKNDTGPNIEGRYISCESQHFRRVKAKKARKSLEENKEW